MLSIIDRVFMPILPLGTVVKLNEEQILEDDLKYLESIRSDLTVQIIGQKSCQVTVLCRLYFFDLACGIESGF